MLKYKTGVGDRVEYRPIGGGAENVSHSTGEVCKVVDEGEMPRYVIRNDNTKKETAYQEMNIVGKV